MGSRLPFVARLFDMCSVNVVMVSYRGYGFSGGSPSEEGIRKDILVIKGLACLII
jgi:hypothetical protein